ncbi:MAG: J domain-containing protein [Proteobacteria bacterium]|nr:J domain-containing protein [Pseudomonadota bacterium]MBU1711178.1 J domain-containing protein [Pseudomonadota bacterium]
MSSAKRHDIARAAGLLGFEGHASIKEIKAAFRRLSKKHHPDTSPEGTADTQKMQEITEAYQLLIEYCSQYRCPLVVEEGESQNAEEWWFDRFGQDPLWGKGGNSK